VSAERAHAAQVKAAEEAAVHRMREQKAVNKKNATKNDQRIELRRAQREAEAAEQEVTKLEAKIAQLTGALSDPELYTTAAGAASATRLGAELDEAKAALERTIDAWTTATERVESLAE
jgi:hypothetical protein